MLQKLTMMAIGMAFLSSQAYAGDTRSSACQSEVNALKKEYQASLKHSQKKLLEGQEKLKKILSSLTQEDLVRIRAEGGRLFQGVSIDDDALRDTPTLRRVKGETENAMKGFNVVNCAEDFTPNWNEYFGRYDCIDADGNASFDFQSHSYEYIAFGKFRPDSASQKTIGLTLQIEANYARNIGIVIDLMSSIPPLKQLQDQSFDHTTQEDLYILGMLEKQNSSCQKEWQGNAVNPEFLKSAFASLGTDSANQTQAYGANQKSLSTGTSENAEAQSKANSAQQAL